MERRRSSLSDGMILIAATAIGLALMRSYFQSVDQVSGGGSRFYNAPLNVLSVGPMLMTWSFALLFLQLRQPGLPLRRIARTTGFGASCATACVIILHFSELGIEAMLYPTRSTLISNPFCITFVGIPSRVAYAIIPVYLLIALSGRWSRSLDWRDRLGKFLGWCWIVLHIAKCVARHFV